MTVRLAKKKGFVALAFFLLRSPSWPAGREVKFELDAPFQDNAHLQREMPAPVWRYTKPGNPATTSFAGQ